MSLLKKLGMSPKDAAEGVVKAAEGVADIVERWAPSAEKKVEMQNEITKLVNESIKEARTFNPKTESANVIATLVNVITDSYSASSAWSSSGKALTLPSRCLSVTYTG